jgi:hypothetical protein
VVSGEASTIELNLNLATVVKISCVDGAGNPIIASIQVRDNKGFSYEGQFGMSDVANMLKEAVSSSTSKVGPIPPGTYEVTATAGNSSITKRITVKGEAAQDVELVLD